MHTAEMCMVQGKYTMHTDEFITHCTCKRYKVTIMYMYTHTHVTHDYYPVHSMHRRVMLLVVSTVDTEIFVVI